MKVVVIRVHSTHVMVPANTMRIKKKKNTTLIGAFLTTSICLRSIRCKQNSLHSSQFLASHLILLSFHSSFLTSQNFSEPSWVFIFFFFNQRKCHSAVFCTFSIHALANINLLFSSLFKFLFAWLICGVVIPWRIHLRKCFQNLLN